MEKENIPLEPISERDSEMMQISPVEAEAAETRDEVLSRWENVESMTDEQLLETMRHDGQLLIHMTAFAKEAVEEGYLVPTRIINERSGQPAGKKAILHPSAAIHFGLNRVFTDQHFIDFTKAGGKPSLFCPFVSHPGIQMTDHDFSVELPAEPDLDLSVEFFHELQSNDSKLIDVMVRGRTEDPWDLTQDIDIRSGFFLIPDLRIDPETLKPVPQGQLTREEYEKSVYFDEDKQIWKNADGQELLSPDQYKYATTTRDYWEQMVENLPEGKPRPRLYFHDGATPSDGVAQFRQDFNIPNPDAESLIAQVNAVGTSEVVHKFIDTNPNFFYGSGEGHALRLKSNELNQDLHLPLAGINIAQLDREEGQRQYDSLKTFIETQNPGPEWYQAQYAAAYHHLIGLKEKITSAYQMLRQRGGEDKADENLIRHLAPELIKARARLEEVERFWTLLIHRLEKQNWKNWEEPEKRPAVDIWER